MHHNLFTYRSASTPIVNASGKNYYSNSHENQKQNINALVQKNDRSSFNQSNGWNSNEEFSVSAHLSSNSNVLNNTIIKQSNKNEQDFQNLLTKVLTKLQGMEERIEKLEKAQEKQEYQKRQPTIQILNESLHKAKQVERQRENGKEQMNFGKRIKENVKNTSSLKNELQSIKNQLNGQLEKMKQQLTNQLDHKIMKQRQFFKINRKFNGHPIKFIYEEHILNPQEKQKSCINRMTYYIDEQGYLLDKNSLYIINGNNEPIKLSEKEMNMLRKINILRE